MTSGGTILKNEDCSGKINDEYVGVQSTIEKEYPNLISKLQKKVMKPGKKLDGKCEVKVYLY
jgi:hypothetical protein